MPPNPKSERLFRAWDALDKRCIEVKINGNARIAFVDELKTRVKNKEDHNALRVMILSHNEKLDLDQEPTLREFIAAYRDSPACSEQ